MVDIPTYYVILTTKNVQWALNQLPYLMIYRLNAIKFSRYEESSLHRILPKGMQSENQLAVVSHETCLTVRQCDTIRRKQTLIKTITASQFQLELWSVHEG